MGNSFKNVTHIRQLFLILFISITHTITLCRAHQLGNKTDHDALLAIKSQLLDHSPAGVFDSWNHSLHHCSWDGVNCGSKHNRVVMLDLNSRGLVGTISPFIGNLSFLKEIELYNNSLIGHIPPEFGRLFKLQILRLFNNMISGKIPSNLSACINLQKLSVGYNRLEGNIPLKLRVLSNLKILSVRANNFSGNLFGIITNMTSLERISAANNLFTGHIPTNIGKFQNLIGLAVPNNEILGTIPTSILNCSLIEILDVGSNKLSGEIPPEIGLRLPNLVFLRLISNQFSGSFPNSVLKLTRIEVLSISENNVIGKVPLNLGLLHSLTDLELDSNQFEGDINFIGSLVNCTNLQLLDLGHNKFTGIIPDSVANFSISLEYLDLRNCKISGKIPKHITNLISLRLLVLSGNNLEGSIPHDLGMLHNLEFFGMGDNRLTDSIPDSLNNISRLSILLLNNNRLQGSITPSLWDCQNLLSVDLSCNHLHGTFQLPNRSPMFVMLYLNNNLLEGSIPLEISNQISLVDFDVSQNKLSGIIPGRLGQCLSLQELFINGNFFHGVIPATFSALSSLQILDLSSNNLSGTIPNYFSKFSQLQLLNLSYNNFEGRVPTIGIFANISAISVDGNVKLCGGILGLRLPKCKIPRRKMHRALKLIISIICALVGVILIVTAWLYFACHRKERVPTSSGSEKDGLMKVSYDMLLKATNEFSPENQVGVGSFGSVFRGTLDGDIVAVKVLNLQTRGASKSFMAECKALRNVRHRNLVGIITACSSIDHQRNDFKALVYEFMPNGSLDERLHGNRVENIMLLQRVDIAINVAHALSYLHHDCEVPIVHCDLKPTNVLLDEDMVARVGDFGFAKFLAYPQHPNQSSSIGVTGTVGYAAPEYGLGSEPSTDADIYSYGILVLELMTGKRPTDSMFQEDYNLNTYTEAAFPDNVLEIVDQMLLADNTEVNDEDAYDIRATQATNQRRYECMVDVISVGIACSKHVPRDRMKIKEAISKLQSAKDNLGNGRQNRNYIARGQLI